MDVEQEEMQFLDLFGIYREAYKIILSWRKLFTQITLSLVLPLSFIFLAHVQVSDLLVAKIIHSEIQREETAAGTLKYKNISDALTLEWAAFWLFKFAYFTFFFIFSLLSTSAVVYTIACVYTGRELTFKKVMSVVPKVWRRLMVTFLVIFVYLFAYNMVAILLLIASVVSVGATSAGIPVLIVLLILYLLGLVYMSILWQLASVVSVLEESYGVGAMIKSRALIRGKTWVTLAIFFKLTISLLVVQTCFEAFVVNGNLGLAKRAVLGILFLVLLCILILLVLVIQTVIYFVCKSHHHENIDKSALSDHLEVYLGEYAPLKGKDVQLEQFYV